MMGLPDGPKSFRIGLVVFIQYRLWQTPSQPASHVAVAITLNAKASSLKTALSHGTVLNVERITDRLLPTFFCGLYCLRFLKGLSSFVVFIDDQAVLCFYSKTGFWPSYYQIPTDMDKNFAHTNCCTEYTFGPT